MRNRQIAGVRALSVYSVDRFCMDLSTSSCLSSSGMIVLGGGICVVGEEVKFGIGTQEGYIGG